MTHIALFWNNIDISEYERAVEVVNVKKEEWAKQFEAVETHHLSCSSLVETFSTIFDLAKEREIEFCILSHRAAWVLDPSKLKTLFQDEHVRNAAISIRAGAIVQKGSVFSPKIPYVDEDFIVINVRHCKELRIPDCFSQVNVESQFRDAGGLHAELLSFFEAVVPYGKLFVYSDGSDIQDLYGEFHGFSLSPYYFSEKWGFVSGDPYRDQRVYVLRESFLRGYDRFLKKSLTQRIVEGIAQSIKRVFRNVNYELKKDYLRLKQKI